MKTTKILIPVLGLGLALAFSAGASAQVTNPPAPSGPPTQVYVAQLPSPTELISAANAQHLSVTRIEQSANQVTAVYRAANGQTNTVTYLPLPANEAGAAGAPAVNPPAGTTSTTTVVYGSPYYPYYYPWGWYYPPVAIGIGFGWHGGWGWGRWR